MRVFFVKKHLQDILRVPCVLSGFAEQLQLLVPLEPLASGKASKGILFLSKKAFRGGCCCQQCSAEPERDSGFLVMLGHGWDYGLFYFVPFAQG